MKEGEDRGGVGFELPPGEAKDLVTLPAKEDIAGVIGCTLSATKSLIHRARETLKEQLKPYLRSGAWGGK